MEDRMCRHNITIYYHNTKELIKRLSGCRKGNAAAASVNRIKVEMPQNLNTTTGNIQ